MKEKNKLVERYRSIKVDYAFHENIFTTDEKADRIKQIIDTKLSESDKAIILLYADFGSYRKLGKQFNLSHMTIRTEVLRIRKIILEEYEKHH